MSAPPRTLYWIGWVLCVLPAPLLVFSALGKFMMPKAVIDGFEHLGWPTRTALPLGIIELACLILFLIPQTAVLGAILLTGYLGGAIATHVRIGEAWYIPAALGAVFWLGLFLRDPRLRALLPLRTITRP